MIWNTKDHQFTATLCQNTGLPCPALARMAKKLVQAMTHAHAVATDEFELEGSGVLNHCPTECIARYSARHDRIRVFCGVDEQADLNALNRFADALLGDGDCGFPASSAPRPCAMIEVEARPSAQTVQRSYAAHV